MKLCYFDIIKRINKLNVLHRLYIHKHVTKYGLYFGQLPILEYVDDHEQCTQREVADFLHVSPPSIATSVKRMQKAGLLEKSADENDLRYNRITITQKGREIAHECRKGFNKIDEKLFSGFNEQELTMFTGYIERMIDNLSTEEFANKTFFSLIAEEKKLIARQNEEDK